MKIGMISLGCPKNLTDTEVILGKLVHAGHEITTIEKDADALIINTCAFIKPAIDESMSEIRRAVRLKEKGVIKFVIVAGCLPRRLRDAKSEARSAKILNKVDTMIGSGDIDKIVDVVNGLNKPFRLTPHTSHLASRGSCLFNWKTPRIKATPKYYSYIKIADGCDNRCTYCSVPSIRGPYKSRPIEDIINEAKVLAGSGTVELILVAQDTTYYGMDLYGKLMLPKLLKKLCAIKGLKWIRIMYAHPAHTTDELIKVIANEDMICKYLDLPLQHICDKILTQMGRIVSRPKIVDLIAKIRRSVPGMIIRTSVIVGFPGESKRDFEELSDFIQKERFERLGVFKFSAESGTSAFKMRGQVPERVKDRRFQRVMQLQGHISKELNRSRIGKTVEVLVENRSGNGFMGRTYADAPEIDGSVFISSPKGGRMKRISPGDVVGVKVNKANSYDLFGTLFT
jgi:ribosomal protein S12 methylthiotransferase